MKWVEKDKDDSKCFKSNFLEICLPLVSFICSVIKPYLHVIQFSMCNNLLAGFANYEKTLSGILLL